MIVEFSLAVIACSFVAVAYYVIALLKEVTKATADARQTLKLVTSDVTVTLYQTNELLAKTNVLVEDVTTKVDTLDPLFVAVADLSSTVSDLNHSARQLTKKANTAKKQTVRVGGVFSALAGIMALLGKKGAN